MSEKLDKLIRQWTNLGAGFSAKPSRQTPDLERLLLDTARLAPSMARLFIMAATWLHKYGDLLAKHRIKRLLHDELETEYQPVLGLLLDIAQQGTHPLEFQTITKVLRPATAPRPLFEIEQRHPHLRKRAERRASELSRKWNLWSAPFELKKTALRPASWIMQRHPSFITRADFRGDLRTSILASLKHDANAGAGDSELQLAKCAGGSRAQVRSALRNLEMTGRIATRRAARANRREVSLLGLP